MEAVFQTRKGKPRLIGIVFQNEFDAQMLNVIWPRTYYTNWYSILIYHRHTGLEIVVSSSPSNTYTYKIDKFDSLSMYQFMATIPHDTQVNFAHLVRDGDKLKPVKLSYSGRWWVLGSKKVELKIEPIAGTR